MKSKIIKLIALIALLAGGFSLSAQNIKTSSTFAIDENITSFEIANLVDKVIYEFPSYNNYGGIQGALSPHFWTITLIMEEGTDVTSLAPVITLAPGATITSRHAVVQDFSQQVNYTVICEDGSTVTYFISAYAQEGTRATGTVIISYTPSSGFGGTTSPQAGNYAYTSGFLFNCTAYPNTPTYAFERWYVNGTLKGTNTFFSDTIPLVNGGGTTGNLLAAFVTTVQFTVTVQSEDTNRGTVSPPSASCPIGGSVSVSASPKSGWLFEGWYLNGSKISSTASFNYQPSANCTLVAKFKPIPPTISGPKSLCVNCGPKPYSVTSPPVGFTWTWSKSANLTISGSSGDTITVTATSSGPAWLAITFDSTELARYNVSVCTSAPVFDSIEGPDEVTPGSETHYYQAHFDNATPSNYEWSVAGAPSSWYVIGNNSDSSTGVCFIGEATYAVYVHGSNACGGSGGQILVAAYSRGGQAYTVYPNPVDDILTISIAQQAGSGAKTAQLLDIRLYDLQGNLALRKTANNSADIQLDVSGLRDGNYFLHIYEGLNAMPYMKQIVVRH